MTTKRTEASDVVFANDYASAYDLLYKDKDYERECDYLETLFPRTKLYKKGAKILDLGCGTGGHAIPLAKRGYLVHGIDLSAAMLQLAEHKSAEAGVASKTIFRQGNVQEFSTTEKYPIILCMFAVLGYQISNEAVQRTLRGVRAHLETGALFVFDVWYGPAVLWERPSQRVKSVGDDTRKVIRSVGTTLDVRNNTARVDYHLVDIQGNSRVKEYREAHHMRYFFEPELQVFLEDAGFHKIEFSKFMAPTEAPSVDSWNVTCTALAK